MRHFMARHLVSLAVLGLLGAVLIAGCGSEPKYCKKVDELELAVQDLREAGTSDPAAVRSAAKEVRAKGRAAAAATREQFPNETTALTTALGALEGTVNQLSKPATRRAGLAALPTQVGAVKRATDALVDNTKEKCG